MSSTSVNSQRIVWPWRVKTLTQDEIQEAVKNEEWQKFRKSLKGCSTDKKIRKLRHYLYAKITSNGLPRVERVRVDNYINALLRGGQLKRDERGNIIMGDQP